MKIPKIDEKTLGYKKMRRVEIKEERGQFFIFGLDEKQIFYTLSSDFPLYNLPFFWQMIGRTEMKARKGTFIFSTRKDADKVLSEIKKFYGIEE